MGDEERRVRHRFTSFPESVYIEPMPEDSSSSQSNHTVADLNTKRSTVISGSVRKTLFLLALPVLAEQLLNTFVAIFDTFMAGQISPAATSAIGLAAYVDWLVSMVVMLVGTGATALVARMEGSGEHDQANHYANQSITLAIVLGVVVSITIYIFAPMFAWYCNMTDEAYRITVEYLRIAAFGHLLLSPTLVGSAALRGIGNMRTPMVIFSVINIVNVIASLSLVYGFGPIPELGVTGIVVGTVIARVVGALFMLAILIRGRTGIRLRKDQMRVVREKSIRILRIGIPAAADGAIMWSGHFIFLAIISRLAPHPLGEAYFAAHIIAVRVEAFAYLPAMAWAAATATMIGQALGANQPRRAVHSGHEGVLQCGLVITLLSVLFYFSAEFIYSVMSKDPLVQTEGVPPFRILVLFQPLLVISIVYVGGLRGAGDTRYPMLITFVGTILIRLPLGYYFGIVCNYGLIGAWVGMFGDMIWRAASSSLRFARGRWLKTKI